VRIAGSGCAERFPSPNSSLRSEFAMRDDTLLIEGVGGILVPLDDRHTVRDWARARSA
jgi:dethiobiotin synthetase